MVFIWWRSATLKLNLNVNWILNGSCDVSKSRVWKYTVSLAANLYISAVQWDGNSFLNIAFKCLIFRYKVHILFRLKYLLFHTYDVEYVLDLWVVILRSTSTLITCIWLNYLTSIFCPLYIYLGKRPYHILYMIRKYVKKKYKKKRKKIQQKINLQIAKFQ